MGIEYTAVWVGTVVLYLSSIESEKEMLVNIGNPVRSEDQCNTFTVTANIYSEQTNDYIAHWEGGTFDNFQEAYDFWDEWEPPKEEIDNTMLKEREKGDYSHHELEIGIWCDNINYDLPFMNMTLDGEHERH